MTKHLSHFHETWYIILYGFLFVFSSATFQILLLKKLETLKSIFLFTTYINAFATEVSTICIFWSFVLAFDETESHISYINITSVKALQFSFLALNLSDIKI